MVACAFQFSRTHIIINQKKKKKGRGTEHENGDRIIGRETREYVIGRYDPYIKPELKANSMCVPVFKKL